VRRAPPRRLHRGAPGRLPGVVVVAAAGLGETSGDHVADGEQHDVEPGAVGPEVVAVTVIGAHELRRQKHANDGAE
jgi:hypothetical protein